MGSAASFDLRRCLSSALGWHWLHATDVVPRKLPTCGQHRCAAMYRPVSCDFLSGEEFSRAWTRLLDSGVQQSEWGFLSSPQAVSVQVSTFQASSDEALRRNSTTILLRLFNPAMRLKCGSKLTRICSTLAALGGVSCRVQAIMPRHCVYGGRPASNPGPYGAHLGIENPCQAFSIIGSDIGRWPCWVCRSRSRMRQETTGLPEISPRKTFGVHVERGVDVERGVFEGIRGVPSLNTFCRPWGKPIREEEIENGCSRECASSIYLQRTSHFEILDLALFR